MACSDGSPRTCLVQYCLLYIGYVGCLQAKGALAKGGREGRDPGTDPGAGAADAQGRCRAGPLHQSAHGHPGGRGLHGGAIR